MVTIYIAAVPLFNAAAQTTRDAFVEGFVGVLGFRGTFCPWNHTRKAEIIEEFTEVDWMELHIKLFSGAAYPRNSA